MLNDILTGYGIFVLEILTILLVILVIVSLIVSHRQNNKVKVGELEIKDLLEEFDSQVRVLRGFNFSEEELKQQAKAEKKAEKQKAKKYTPILLSKNMEKRRLYPVQSGVPCCRGLQLLLTAVRLIGCAPLQPPQNVISHAVLRSIANLIITLMTQ